MAVNVDDALTPGSDAYAMMEYYRGLIGLRRVSCPFLTAIAPTAALLDGNAIAVTWADESGAVGYAVINPTAQTLTIDLPEGWTASRALVQGDRVQPDAVPENGPLTVDACSVTFAVRAE